MKGKYTRQYDLTLTDREMQILVQGLRIYVRDYNVQEEDSSLLMELEEVFHGDTGGRDMGAPVRA